MMPLFLHHLTRCLSCVALLLFSTLPLQAQTTHPTSAKLQDLFNQITLPYSRQSFNLVLLQLRESAPELFLQGAGRGAKLGPAWVAGNPYWEQSRSTIEQAISAYEKQHGPIFLVSTQDFVQQFTPPWTDTEFDFLRQFVDTPEGKILLQLLDTSITGSISKKIQSGKEINFSEKNLQALQMLDQQAQKKFSEALLAVTQFNATQKAAYQRADALVGKIATTDSLTFGQKIMQQSLLRFFEVAYGVLPDLNRYIEGFRLSLVKETNASMPAAPSTEATPAPIAAPKTP